MNKKQEVYSSFKQFLINIENQFNTKPKTIITENGTKFILKEFQARLNNLGIHQQLTCVYTSQQNGVVERKHKHILQVARGLMKQSNMPFKYWGESIKTFVYLINRTPSSKLRDDTPFSLICKTTNLYPLKSIWLFMLYNKQK